MIDKELEETAKQIREELNIMIDKQHNIYRSEYDSISFQETIFYQIAVNAFLINKLAELQLKINKLENNGR